jgi:hypothetical protein
MMLRKLSLALLAAGLATAALGQSSLEKISRCGWPRPT